MTAFEERLARIGAEGGAVTASGANESYGSTANMSARKDTRDAADPNDQGGMGPFGVLLTLLALPLAMAIGAASVVAGGVVQVVFIDGGLTGSTPIPPNLGTAAFGIALVVSFLADRVVRFGHLGPIAVSIGFIGAMFGEGRLAEMYPKLWMMIYQAEYLRPMMEMAGL